LGGLHKYDTQEIHLASKLFRNKAGGWTDFSGNMTTLIARQTQLIEMNVTWLQQALALIGSIDDRAFTDSPKGLEPHRVSGHLRHVLEFYECFLDGVESGYVDYDARRRDESLERSRSAAIDKLRGIVDRLHTTRELCGDAAVFVRMEDVVAEEFEDPCLMSSVARELQVLSNHTIHHFALIAMTLRLQGHDVHRDFGMAPSTLRFQATRAASRAQAA